MSNELSADIQLSHYRIVSKIGTGGMGETYLADDTKLDRQVSPKVLLAELAGESDRVKSVTHSDLFGRIMLRRPPFLFAP